MHSLQNLGVASRVFGSGRIWSWLSIALALGSLSLRAQTPTQPPQTQNPAGGSARSSFPAQTSSNRDDAEAAALAHQLAVLAGDEAGSTSGAATTNDAGPAGIIPLRHGFNATLITTNQHDSTDGWQSLLIADVAYRFSPSFSINVNVPTYTYINIYGVLSSKTATKNQPASTTYGYKTQHLLLGDTTVTGEFEAHPRLFDYNLTATLGLPTGNDLQGLGAGQVTYEINNHFEHVLLDWLTPELELGIGDSPNLDDERARRSFTDIGENAHFQFGFGIALPKNITFTTDAYEDLPLASQTVITSTSNGKKGKQLKIVTTTSQESIGEDNGFLDTLDIPLNPHVTLSGIYNRSLRDKTDTAGFSLTFTLRGTPREREQVR